MTFQEMLSRGLGRAVLYLQERDAKPFRKAILHACSHFLGYDSQTEPTRGHYLYDIIQATGEPEWYVTQVIEWLETGKEIETPHTLLELVTVIANNGDTRARAAVYSAFARSAQEQDDYAAEEVVTLDGIEGYFAVARQWMQYPRTEENHWREGWLLDFVEKVQGKNELQAALERIQSVEPGLMVYVEQAREKRRAWKKRNRERPTALVPTYEELRQRIADPKETARRHPWRRWSRDLDETVLEQLAHDLLRETDCVPLLKYLHLFQERPFPLDPESLLELARSRDEDLSAAARRALSQLSHPAVRELALELMKTPACASDAVDLLLRNYESGDYTRLLPLVERPQSRDEFHWLGLSLGHLIKAHPSPEAALLLLGLYEGGFCGLCRNRVVELMLSLGTLPQSLREECQFDSDLATRELVTG